MVALAGIALPVLGSFGVWPFVPPFAALMVLAAVALTTERF